MQAKIEIHLRNDENTVGLVSPPKRMVNQSARTSFRVETLKEMVEMADDIGWENIDIFLAPDHPMFIKQEETDGGPYLGIAPLLPDDEIEE